MFQKAELLIKHLLTLGNVKIVRGEETTYEEQASVWHKRTMGNLFQQFLEKHYTDKNPVSDFDVDGEKCGIAVSFTFGGDAVAREKSIAAMVRERNEFVHHLLDKLDPSSEESCREIASYLDAQREMVLPEITHLQADLKFVTSHCSELFAFWASDESREMFRLTGIQQCPVIVKLAETAGNSKIPWTSLANAAKAIPDDCTESVQETVARFNCKSLTALLVECEMFDLWRDPQNRMVYRLKASSTEVT